MINVKDFGGIDSNNQIHAVGNDTAFSKALDQLRSEAFNPTPDYQGAEKLFIPAGHYFLSETLDIKGMSLIIEGESCGGPGGLATVLEWTKPITGIRIQRFNTGGTGKDDGKQPGTGKGGDCTILRNLSLKGGGGTATGTDETIWFHGIHARSRFIAEDVSVEGFAHSGIFMHASDIVDELDPTRGNANGFALSRILTRTNGVAGLWVQGNDANAGTVTQLSSTGNGQYGVYDASFLGNTYVGCHMADNGQRSQVSLNNNRYHVVYGQGSNAKSIKPGTNPAVWRLVSAGDTGEYPAWTAAGQYFEGAFVSHNGYRYQLVNKPAFASREPGTNDAVWRLVDVGGSDSKYPAWQQPSTVDYAEHGTVSYLGRRYRLLKGKESEASAIQPGTDASVWIQISDGSEVVPGYPAWGEGSVDYLDGGAYMSLSDTATNVLVGCYSEAGQPASYGGSAAFFVGGDHGAGTYGTAPALAGNQQGLRVSPGLRASDANDDSALTTTIGDVDHSGAFFKFEHSVAAPEAWRIRMSGLDVIWDYGDLATTRVFGVTGPLTKEKFGRSGALPHALFVSKLVIGGTSEKGVHNSLDARRVMCLAPDNAGGPPEALTAKATIPGDWAHGDFCFNATPDSNGVLGWSCTTSSEPAVPPGKPYKEAKWTPVRLMGKVAAQVESSAADLATLRSDFNNLLIKMRDAGILDKQ